MSQAAKQKADSVPLFGSESSTGSSGNGDGAGASKGKPQRNYPPTTLKKALAVASAIQDGASGMPVNRLTLAELMHNSPSSSTFATLLQASRMYGLTADGPTPNMFALTPRGEDATGTDEEARIRALRQAVLSIQPYNDCLTAFNNSKKIPAPKVCIDTLTAKAKVPAARAEECLQFMLADARFVRFTRIVGDSEYVDLDGAPSPAPSSGPLHAQEEVTLEDDEQSEVETTERPNLTVVKSTAGDLPQAPVKPKKIFIVHGKDHRPMEQVKKTLDEFKVPCAVALIEPHAGRPISEKVMKLMQECTSAIVIF